MKALVLTAFAALSIAQLASANPYIPRCGQGYAWDAYGRGAKAVFKGGANLRARANDEACYQLGMQYAMSLRQQTENMERCETAFHRGMAIGTSFGANTLGSDSCFTLGHAAGRADLDIAAREGDSGVAGDACVKAYRTGRQDAMNSRVNDPTQINALGNQEKARMCYSMGWFEAGTISL